MLYENVSELIGNTPLVHLKEIEKEYNLDCKIYGKLEKQNPGGSIKDRAVYQMLLNAVSQGVKLEGANIVEATSGNTGIAIAMLSNYYKYKAYIVMPTSMSQQRKDLIRSFGATLVLVDGPLKNSIAKANELLKELPNSLMLDQFKNLGNLQAHYLHTGKEIVDDLPDVDYVFAGFGTGGTISGIGKFFKENKVDAKAIGIEPEESAFITNGVAGKHGIPGIGAGFKPDNLKLEYVDEVNTVNSEQTNKLAREILCKEGLFVGVSSGASLLGAINYIKKNNLHNKKIVVIFPDTGERYSWN
ncbi:MAG: cysteine synthase family protein [Bacilli bacterium]